MNYKKFLLLFSIFYFVLFISIKAADSHVRINSIGFLPNGVKGFTCAQPGTTFEVRNASTGAIVYTGNLGGAINATDSGETVYKGDFSSFTTPGTYYVNVPGVGRSVNFTISDTVYNNPFIICMRSMYLWRCGTSVSLVYNGDTFAHGACHLNDANQNYIGFGNNRRDGTGGWHDAGDYNKYTVNAGITVGMMFMAWEHFPAIRDLSWGLPNTAPGYPDFLKEMKWEIDWVLKMAYPDGSGRVSHKLSALNFCGFIMPENETATRYFVDWGSAATASYVAMLAMAARIFRPYDQAYADTCINAAWVSYDFLRANTANKAPDQSAFSTGTYATTDADDRLWAAAEMWATTGSTIAHQDFTTRANAYSDKIDADFDWGNVKNLGMYTYLLCTRTGKVAAIYDDIRNDLLADANQLLVNRNNHGYGRMLGTNGTSYYWGCNGAVARQAMLLQIANMISPNPEYINACLDILGYLFGRNMHRRSYVTGLGANPPMYPHDRPSGADNVVNPWPGYLVGGSNGTNSGDPVLSAMPAGLPPAHYWQDHQDSYASNEIAINWQGALIYALAGFYRVSGTPTWTPTITRTGTITQTLTFTRTNTFTFTRTHTITPTFSNSPSHSPSPTRTWTLTWTQTGTPTRTNTPVITNTWTITNTFSQTVTSSRTASPTWTQTGTPTSINTVTSSLTRTVSPTLTRTDTISSNTPTVSLTASFTGTPTWTRTISQTSTPSNTLTRTITPTWTVTNSPSLTITVSPTNTRTVTFSFTVTFTYTRTNTPTFTWTDTISSNTPTVSSTWTRTNSSTPTVTPSYTSTRTSTPSNTLSFTHTRTNTPTWTFTDTVLSNTPTTTQTRTQTFTSTSTLTGTPTFTFTNTRTFTLTWTRTATLTLTYSHTFTRTITPSMTVTITNTLQPTLTYTFTPTPTLVEDKEFNIRNISFYPNPYNPVRENLAFYFELSQRAKMIKVIIYTVGYRKIKQINYSERIYGPGMDSVPIESKYLQSAANGVYHIIIGAINLKNEEIWSKPEPLIILR